MDLSFDLNARVAKLICLLDLDDKFVNFEERFARLKVWALFPR